MLVAREDGGTLRVEVEDWGRGECTMRDWDAQAARDAGCGSSMRSRTGGAPRHTAGKTVWFELART